MHKNSCVRRKLVMAGLSAGSAGAFIPGVVRAQGSPWPSRPIRMVVPWPAGGLVDIAARQLASRLQTALGQPVVIENRVGAGGSLGAEHVSRAPADGHTLLFATSSLTVGAALQARPSFRPMQDLQPVALVANAPSILVAGPSIQVNSLKELLDLAHRRPGQLTYASAGIGSFAHLVVEWFKVESRIFAVHVPYTGAPGAMNDQLAGRIDFQMANITVALPHVKSGRVKALAITSRERFPGLPDTPTMIEAGIKDFEADQWLGLFGPQGLPAAVSDRLSAEVNRALVDPALREVLQQAGIQVAAPGSMASFDRLMKAEFARWQQVVRRQNLRME
jgi:tripartite-type tricarboxylate transporter receptor subunit TctC